MQPCAKGYPNWIPNGREKLEQTNTHTNTHTHTFSCLYNPAILINSVFRHCVFFYWVDISMIDCIRISQMS